MAATENKKFKIGIVGFGIGKMHAWAFKDIPYYFDDYNADQIELIGICTAPEHKETTKVAINKFGFRFSTTDYKELVNSPDIDIVCVGVPDYLHEPIVNEALIANKHVFCEKPLAYNLSQAKAMEKLAKKTGCVHQMGFQMRFGPAAQEAKKIIEGGILGEIFTFRCTYQHSGYENPDRPMSWRLDNEKAGGGALFDLGAHAVDLVRYLLGNYKRLVSVQETFIKERPISKGASEKQKVLVDDVTFITSELENGVIGTIEATRLATGIRRGPELAIHGSQGSLQFNAYSSPEVLDLYLNNPKKIPSASGFEKLFLGPRNPVPLEIISLHDFLKNVDQGKTESPNFEDGLRVQEVLAACIESNKTKKWIALSQ